MFQSPIVLPQNPKTPVVRYLNIYIKMYNKLYAQQLGPMFSVLEFLDPLDTFKLGLCNKNSYESVVPRFRPAWSVQCHLMYGLNEKLPITEQRKKTMRKIGIKSIRPFKQTEIVEETRKVKWTKMGDVWYQGGVNEEGQKHGMGCQARSERFDLGQFKNGKHHGKFLIIYQDGDMNVSTYENGTWHGVSELTKFSGEVIRCKYNHGKFVE